MNTTLVLGMDAIALMRFAVICLLVIGLFEVVKAAWDWWQSL